MLKFLVFLLIFSCSDQVDWRFDGRLDRQNEEEVPFDFFHFESRISPELSISGTLCDGNEVVVSEGRTHLCERNQWLIFVDNQNTCTPLGCTDFEVSPIAAALRPRSSSDLVVLYSVEPAVPVAGEIENILERTSVIFSPREEPVVVVE